MEETKELKFISRWSFSYTYYTMHGYENIKVSRESLMEYMDSTPLPNFIPTKANVDLYDNHNVCRCVCEGK
jgi:hypothetical protein